MTKHILLWTLALCLYQAIPAASVATAETATHADDHTEEGHGDDHDQEKKERPDHDSHGDDSHGDEHEGHDESKEGNVEISPEAAVLTGIELKQAGPDTVKVNIPLNGRITLNENNVANVRARFSGFVKKVHVNFGDIVTKGGKLATVESNESLKSYHVTSPINGIVLKRHTNTGDVTGDSTLFVIADLSTVWAKYHIFPRDIPHIKKGQTINIRTIDEKMRGNAPISMLFPTADELSQTVIAIAELSNTQGIWRPGMTIEGSVAVDEKQVSVAVPRTALQFMEEKHVVFIKDGHSYSPRFVTVGMQGADNVEVTAGLTPGETYVSAGSFVVKADILKGTAAHEH